MFSVTKYLVSNGSGNQAHNRLHNFWELYLPLRNLFQFLIERTNTSLKHCEHLMFLLFFLLHDSVQGAVVQEVHQTFDKSVTQVVRLYNGSKFAEFHWTVGRLYVK